MSSTYTAATCSNVFLDLYYLARLLNDNEIVLIDDSRWPDVAKATAFARCNLAGHLKEVDLAPFRQDRTASMTF